MRHSASWMTIWDDRILEIINKSGHAVPVKDLADHEAILRDSSTVSRRCQKLAEGGLLIDLGNGVYDISEEGVYYLRGDYDAEKGRYIENMESETDTHEPESTESGTNGV